MNAKNDKLTQDYQNKKNAIGNTMIEQLQKGAVLILSSFMIIAAVAGFAATKASQADLDALKKVHADDTKETRDLIIYLQIENYTEQIYLLKNKSNATSQDKINAGYLKSRQDDLILKFQKK